MFGDPIDKQGHVSTTAVLAAFTAIAACLRRIAGTTPFEIGQALADLVGEFRQPRDGIARLTQLLRKYLAPWPRALLGSPPKHGGTT